MSFRNVVYISVSIYCIIFLVLLHRCRYFSTNVSKELVKNPHPSWEVMSAWQVEKFGGIENLKLSQSVRVPEVIRPNAVRIKVLSSSVNPIDLAMMAGYGDTTLSCLKKFEECRDNRESSSTSTPLILGRDFCGEVLQKGPEVKNSIKIGDLVYGTVSPHQQGSYADQIVVDDTLVCTKPEKLSLEEAASLPYTAMTAWCALKVTGDLMVKDPKSQRVLVIGASGGVGTTAVQLLKAWGSTVIATCSPDAIPLVQSINPDLIIDYTKKESMQDIEQAGKYDIILDASGNVNYTTYLPFLKDWSNSKFISLRSPVLKNVDDLGIVGGMLMNAANLFEINFMSGALRKGSTVRWGFFVPIGYAFAEIDQFIKTERVKPVIDSTFKFNDLPNALLRLKEGHLRGKVVVSHTS